MLEEQGENCELTDMLVFISHIVVIYSRRMKREGRGNKITPYTCLSYLAICSKRSICRDDINHANPSFISYRRQ